MKKWMYVISVGSMLAVFLFFYTTHLKQADLRDKQRAEEARLKKEADDAAKKVREDQARKDAEDRAAKRIKDEQDKEAKHLAEMLADNKKIQDDIDKNNALADDYSKLISRLEIELNTLRTNKEKLNRETFEISKQVEAARIEKHNAELEIQRITDMIAKRAADSSLTRAPELPKPSS